MPKKRLSPSARAAASERMKALHADPEFKERRREALKALNADPEFKERQRAAASERMKALNADPEFQARHRERMKALHADPEFQARHRAAASERKAHYRRIYARCAQDIQAALGNGLARSSAATLIAELGWPATTITVVLREMRRAGVVVGRGGPLRYELPP